MDTNIPVAEVYIMDGVVFDMDDNPVTCSWFAMCDNNANDVIGHPILGGVPTCQRCITKFDLNNR